MAKLIEITGKALAGEWGTDDETGEGIPVLRTTNFTNEGVVDYSDVVTRTITKKNIDEKFLREGDIIIEKSGGSDKYPVGRVIYFDGPSNTYLFNNFTGLLRVQDQEKWFPKYVFYSLYGNYRRGGTRPFENKTTGLHNLKTDDYVSRYDVAEVDYSKQKEICIHLDKLYSIIKMREDEIAKLDELIKARFVEMFGDYMTKPGIQLVELAEITGGLTKNSKRNTFEKKMPYLRVANVFFNRLDLGEVLEIGVREEEIEKTLLKQGDLLFVEGNGSIEQIGRVAVWDGSIDPILHQNHLIKARFKENVILPKFALFYFMSQEGRKQIVSKSVSTSGLNTLSVNKIGALSVPVPPIELQNTFRDFAEQVDKSKVAVQKALNETQTLFDSLMQEYFG